LLILTYTVYFRGTLYTLKLPHNEMRLKQTVSKQFNAKYDD